MISSFLAALKAEEYSLFDLNNKAAFEYEKNSPAQPSSQLPSILQKNNAANTLTLSDPFQFSVCW